MNPLNAAAATLFALVSRIRNRAQHPDPDALRRSVVAEIRAFESRAMQAGIDERSVKVARYAICATLDDVVLNTPWGGASSWSTQSMVGTFHRETVGGDRFYDLLARLEKDPATNIDLLEFLFMCLALGFEGRLRVEQGGRDKHAQVRAGLASIIRAHRGAAEADLSPHWQGVNRPHRTLSIWRPVWIAVAAVAALLGTSFVALGFALSMQTSDLTDRLAALDRPGPAELERRAPPVIPVETPQTRAQIDRVSDFLEVEIAEGLVKVFQNANTITVRLTGAGMFASASDVLKDKFELPLTRVADALNDTDGPVIVAGHSDNVPIRTARYPNNLALSLARAESVKAFLAAAAGRSLPAEGRGAGGSRTDRVERYRRGTRRKPADRDRAGQEGRAMMGKVLRALGSSIGITVIVALSLSLCIWFLGGFLGIGEARPLQSVAGRLVGLGILWILALIVI